eukprot:1159329-Pelagomonas_calceolata.AAC.6
MFLPKLQTLVSKYYTAAIIVDYLSTSRQNWGYQFKETYARTARPCDLTLAKQHLKNTCQKAEILRSFRQPS